MYRTARSVSIVTVAMAMTLAGCGSGGSGDNTAREDGVVIALGTEPATLDGQRSSDGNARLVVQNIADGLVQRDPEGNLIPGLAAAMPENVGETSWRVELRDDVTFHNGESLDAELVVANLERVVDPDVANENVDIVGTIASASVVEDGAVEITTTVPDPLLPSRLATIPIFAGESLEGDAAASTVIGSGPYELVEWNRGSAIHLELFADYWGSEPPIKDVEFRFIPDPGSQEAGLRAGELDLITNLSPDSVDSVPQVFSGKSGESPAMILNTQGGVTKDVRVRRAMNMAVDQEEIAAGLFGGRAQPQMCQMSNEQLDHFNASLSNYEYDPAEAKKLIAEAGAEGATVSVVGESGRWLRDRETTEAVAAAWSEIGLEPQLQILEFNNYLDVLFDRSERPDAIFISYGDPMLTVQSTLDSVYSADGAMGSNGDTALTQLIDDASRTIDETERHALLDAALERGCDEAMMAFLPAPENLYGGAKELTWSPEPDASVRVERMSWN